jgi:hypothetical protein
MDLASVRSRSFLEFEEWHLSDVQIVKKGFWSSVLCGRLAGVGVVGIDGEDAFSIGRTQLFDPGDKDGAFKS